MNSGDLMSLRKKLELIKKSPTIEIITQEELVDILRKKHPITYCGYETSGPIHLGHFLAISKQIDLQQAGFKVKVLWPDLHTHLNRKGSMEWIHSMQLYSQHCFIACGLSKKKTIWIQGSDFQLRKSYVEDLLKFSLLVTIKRARRSMTLIGRRMEDARVSQIVYPLMQALDIAYLKVDLAHGGMDQRKIHMIAREFLPEVGYPKPTCLHTAVLTALTGPGDKMSSSKPETMIAVHDPPKVIKERIKNAFCPACELRGNPIVEICRFIIFPKFGKLKVERARKYGGDISFSSFDELALAFSNAELHPLDLKNAVAAGLIKIFKPVRKYFERRKELLKMLR
jgi:tyrosyl-tRNA synthetase